MSSNQDIGGYLAVSIATLPSAAGVAQQASSKVVNSDVNVSVGAKNSNSCYVSWDFMPLLTKTIPCKYPSTQYLVHIWN